MDTFETVQTWLRNNYNIGVSAEWLTACLEWIQQENQGLLLPLNELLSKVYEQWLLSDLSEIGEPVLPQNIASADKFELVSNYPLQLLSLVDIGFPLYGQKQKLQGCMNPNEDVSADKPFQPMWEPKPSRMLLLQLTDGHTQIQAMEYRQIKDLHPMLPSGLKLLVTGTVLCRRGVIMLTPECLQVLGGEVDALVEQNTPLASLENAMVRNREDEGKHARKDFSGRFISWGVDKKIDNSHKPFTTRVDIKNNHKVTKFDSSQVKLEPQQPASVYHGIVNLKQEMGQVATKKSEPVHFKQELDQWKNEMNYDDCFDDELDLEEINALDSTSATEMEDETSFKSSFNSIHQKADSLSFLSNPLKKESHCDSRLKTQNVEDINRLSGNIHSKVINHTVTNNLCAQQSNLLINDIEYFDDDFEIDDISYSFAPSVTRNKAPETISSEKIDISDVKIEKNASVSKPSTNAINCTMISMSSSPQEQHNFIESSIKSTPSILFQDVQRANKSVKLKTTLSSMLSQSNKNVPSMKNKLFKIKSGSQEKVLGSGSVGRSQATKQCKLSDMFRANANACKNKTKQTSIDNDDDCCIINDDILAHSSPMFSQKYIPVKVTPRSSKLEDVALDKAITSCTDNSSIAFNCTIKNARCSSTKMKLDQQEEDISNIPKEVVRPLPLSADCSDTLDTANSLPFQYLSSMTSMQCPISITVKAYISAVINSLDNNGGAFWSLACRINDGTASLDVDLTDSVLTELIGFSAKDCVAMQQKINTDPQAKTKLTEGYSKCLQQLINISCLMEISKVSTTRKPVIERLIPLSKQHVNELIKRVERYLCA